MTKELQKNIESTKIKIATIEGELITLYQELLDQYECKTIEEAVTQLNILTEKIHSLGTELRKKEHLLTEKIQ